MSRTSTLADRPRRAGRAEVESIALERIRPNAFSVRVYGDPDDECEDLLASVAERGILVPLVVTPEEDGFELLSGHRRWACARRLGLEAVPCELRRVARGAAREAVVLAYNRQRRKNFSQMMREADALERGQAEAAERRRRANLARGSERGEAADRRKSDGRGGRTDATVAAAIGLGGKDVYRQARAVWRAAAAGDERARAAVARIDAGTKSIHAAYKDLRRRDRYGAGFRPTPYDVWPFRRDEAHGVPHPGAIPGAIVAHLLHYYSRPGDLVVDPMAGGGTTLDVCAAMGRRCLAYDLAPARGEIVAHDVTGGLPEACAGCDLIFVDPPYHTLRAWRYAEVGVGEAPLAGWLRFLEDLARAALERLRPGGYLALLLANQTEKDLPAGYGYLDHAFYGLMAMRAAGFVPERRVSCPMSGAYLPQQVARARREGRMLGQVRDLVIGRKPRPGELSIRDAFVADATCG
jgi:ParB/RepB/Spo0J family partition protein